MNCIETYETIQRFKICAIVRTKKQSAAIECVHAMHRGGIRVIEVTYSVPGALRIVEELRSVYDGSDTLIGMGTVLDGEGARLAIASGAQFLITPALSERTMKVANRYQIPIIPGISSPTEAVHAMELGAHMLKLFPADVLGIPFLKAINGPLPQARLVPTGGVSLENASDWLSAGAAGLGVGGTLSKGADEGEFDAIEKRAAAFTQIVKEFTKA